MKFLVLFFISFPVQAALKCTETMLHDKTAEIARSKPMEKPFLIQKVQSECPDFPVKTYEAMLHTVGMEGSLEHCIRQYLSSLEKKTSSLFFDVECRSNKFTHEWKSIIKRTGADPLLLAQDVGSDWDKVVVRKQTDGLFRVNLGSDHCVVLSVVERKIDSSTMCKK